MNFLFPLNIPLMMLIILVVSYMCRCLARIISQTFRTEDYEWGKVFDKVCELPAMSGLYVSPTLRLFHILPLSCQSVSLCNEEGYAPLAYLTGIRFISTFLPLTIL